MKKKKKFIVEICFIVLIVLGLFFLNKAGNNINKDLAKSGELTIGTFIQFTTQYIGFSRSYKYCYQDNQGEKVTVVNSKKMPDKVKPY